MIKKLLLIVYLLVSLFLIQTRGVMGQEGAFESKSMEGRIVRIVEEKEIELMGSRQTYQKLEILINKGELKDQKIIVENGNLPLANIITYKTNDKVLINKETTPEGKQIYNINDFVRNDSLILLVGIFVALSIIVSKKKGVTSIVSMGITFIIIFKLMLPLIHQGGNPIAVAIGCSAIIIPLTFYLSHGFNKKTTAAIIGTLISLLITGILAVIFISLAKLTGLSSEESGMLLTIKNGDFDMKGILLAGILVGSLGVLDDITISQAAIVEQLKEASKNSAVKEIFARAMKIGEDHITSMINTLVLVYAGSFMPLLLIFIDNPHPISEVINYEFIAEEVVRTLVGSIGLITAVPITTLIATWIIAEKNKNGKNGLKVSD